MFWFLAIAALLVAIFAFRGMLKKGRNNYNSRDGNSSYLSDSSSHSDSNGWFSSFGDSGSDGGDGGGGGD